MTKFVTAAIKAMDSALKGSEPYRIFLFGSAVIHKRTPSDVDVLVIYPDEKSLLKAKDAIEALSDFYPFDVLYASEDEERELDLINTMKAIRLL